MLPLEGHFLVTLFRISISGKQAEPPLRQIYLALVLKSYFQNRFEKAKGRRKGHWK